MKHYIKIFSLLSILFCLCSCNNELPPQMDLESVSIIPKPLSVTGTGSSFEITSETSIFSDGDLQTAVYLSDLLKPATGFDMDVKPATR